MDGTNLVVGHRLPIDPGLLHAALLRLRRDTLGREARWTLGALGALELDAQFVADADPPSSWRTNARLWDPDRFAFAPVLVRVSPSAVDECELGIETTGPLDDFWAIRTEALSAIAHAAAGELGEELLWHASRPGIAQLG
jgi:hypothetical protein